MGRYTVRQADRVTDRQNDSMTVWQNSRAAKEPALVLLQSIKFLAIYLKGTFSLHVSLNLEML